MAEAHLSRTELVGWRDDGTGDRDRIVGHLAACADCRHVAAELERERPAEAAAPRRLRPRDFVTAGLRAGGQPARGPAIPRPVVYLAAAASLLLAVMVVPSWWTAPPDSALRGEGAVVTPASPVDTAIAADALAFEWTASPAAGALRLYVVALDDAGAPVIDHDVTGTRYAPTPDERGRFRAGREYHWFVEYRGAGAGAGVSASARFRIE